MLLAADDVPRVSPCRSLLVTVPPLHRTDLYLCVMATRTRHGSVPFTPSTAASGMSPSTYTTYTTGSAATSPSQRLARAADAKARAILNDLVSVSDLQSIVHYQTSGLLREPRATTNTIVTRISRRGGEGIKSRDVPSRGVPIRTDGKIVSPLILASRTLNRYASNTRGVDPGSLAELCDLAFREYDTDRDGKVAIAVVRRLAPSGEQVAIAVILTCLVPCSGAGHAATAGTGDDRAAAQPHRATGLAATAGVGIGRSHHAGRPGGRCEVCVRRPCVCDAPATDGVG